MELEEEVGSLQRLKSDYREIVEHATEIIFKLDANGTFNFISNEFERVLGYTNEDLAGKHFAGIVHPEDLELCMQTFEVLKKFGKADDNIWFRVKHFNGPYKWVDCSAVCLFDENNIPTHTIGFAHDITQLKNVLEELRFSEERYRSLFDALGEGAVLIDRNGTVIASNRCAENIFGLAKKEMANLNTFKIDRRFYHENGSDFPLHTHPSFLTLKTGKPMKNMIMGVERPDESITWISINTEPIYYSINREQADAVVASFADITQAKKDKEEIQRNQQLYIEATKAVAQAVVDAQEKERAEIGYELHDNVNQILSTARVFLDLAMNDEKERIKLIAKSASNISNAVNEIRRISRSLVPASLSDLGLILSIEDLIDSIRLSKVIKVEFYHSGDIEKAITVQGKLMLFRIIQEQITNVIKHAEASQLVIELIVDSGSLSLSITDNGKGFDTEKVKTKNGVGLHNIANRTELFNGKINMVTSPGNGCKLNIIIPL
ncbi:MAG TPA: PAS domain S-box protein [Flavitalea sp.]|nr:PAS domain S-box protein [Flavitalea sp.]